jgi:hypothetical protein
MIPNHLNLKWPNPPIRSNTDSVGPLQVEVIVMVDGAIGGALDSDSSGSRLEP